MRSFYILFSLLLLCCAANAQQQNPYDAGLIAKNLLPYAKAVVRNEEVTTDVKDLDNAIYHIKRAITVLNKNGDDAAMVEVWYNKSHVIKSIKGTIYNSFGVAVKKISESDFEDVYADDGFSLMGDVRVKYYRPGITDYPYTVEYEYEVRSKQTLVFDDWEPNPETGIAVEKSTYTFSCKPDFTIHYKEINMPTTVSTGTDKDGFKTYTWQVNNLKAVKEEPYTPNPENYLSMVKVAPVKFEYEGLTGSFTNWNELGKWIYDKLLVNRQLIPTETAQHIMDITAGITDPKLKARKIYEYMQSKTHYVSVQVGIGYFQPFTAEDVDRQNYGDCKALVNYTQALLKVAGIDSYYCVVTGDHSRKISMLNDFASMDQANHIILCIPFKNDTTWCDCTSETIPFGYIGDFTDDRTVLACTPDGGKLLHTPKYTSQTNLQNRKADFTIDEQGDIAGNITTTFHGVQYENREEIIGESSLEKTKYIQQEYLVNNMDVKKLEFNQDKSLQPVTTENLTLSAPEYASVGDNKIDFLINPVNHREHAPKEVRNRVTDVYINEGFTDEDEVSYTLPQGYHLNSEPLKVSLNKPFGNFSATMHIEGNKLVYKRKLQVIDGTYPKDSYEDLVDFYRDVVDADAYVLTLVKN